MNWLWSIIKEIFEGDMNETPTTPTVPSTNVPPEAVNAPTTQENPDTLLPWVGEENCRHNVRVICDLEGLSFADKNALSQTVHCESNYNPNCIHPNLVGGVVASTDYGIAQINDYWHIGEGKDFPSSQYVLDNPEACIRWMCKQFKSGNANMWVCHLRSLYLNYTP